MRHYYHVLVGIIAVALVCAASGTPVSASAYGPQVKEIISAAMDSIQPNDARINLVLDNAGIGIIQMHRAGYQSKDVIAHYKNTLSILMKGSYVHKLASVNSGKVGMPTELSMAGEEVRPERARALHAPFQWEPTFTTSDTKLYSIFTAFDLGPKLYNYPPETPSSPNPPNGATDVGVNVTLGWVCTDPDEDVLRYDVYFGDQNPPSLRAGDVYETSWTVPETLEFNAQYWWQIVAKDQESQTTGPVWTFTTIEGDTTAPTSAITDPLDGSYITTSTYTIHGTAADETGGSGVQLVEVSVDGGVTWRPATGTTAWSYEWNIQVDKEYTIVSKAKDNANNVEVPGAGVDVTVDRVPPMIYAAGYWDTEISTAFGGPFTMLAAVLDEDVDTVEIYIGGAPTGALLMDDGSQGDWAANDGLYSLAIGDVGPGVPPGQFLAEIVATDLAGNQSMMWPYLEIYAEDFTAPGKPDAHAVRELKNHLMEYLNFIGRGPMQPKIMVGGFWDTVVTTESGGDLTMLMLGGDPDGDSDIVNIELYYGGLPTSVYLSDDGMPFDWTANDNLYMLISPVDPGLPADTFLIEGVARDSSGNLSHMYPYLTVNP
ncbi:hypothetical protein JW905_09985 [bacterium]|nr:hypothetical protein [candidate division CSSED10-310 bacterium]